MLAVAEGEAAADSADNNNILAVVLASVLELHNALPTPGANAEPSAAVALSSLHPTLGALKSRFGRDYTGLEQVLLQVTAALGSEDDARRELQPVVETEHAASCF